MRFLATGTLVQRQHCLAAWRLHLRTDQVVGPIATLVRPGFESDQNGALICAVRVFGFPAFAGQANHFGNRPAARAVMGNHAPGHAKRFGRSCQ